MNIYSYAHVRQGGPRETHSRSLMAQTPERLFRLASGVNQEGKAEGCGSGLLCVQAGQLFQTFLNNRHGLGLTQDNQDGIVSSQSAQDFGPLFPVQGFGYGLSAAGQGTDDQQVARPFGGGEQGGQQSRQGRCMVPGFGRQRIVSRAFGIVDFDQTQLTDVAREGCLRHVEAALRQQLAQVFLAGHAILADDRANGGVAFRFPHDRRMSGSRWAAQGWLVRTSIRSELRAQARLQRRSAMWAIVGAPAACASANVAYDVPVLRLMKKLEKSKPPRTTPMGGMIMSFTSEFTILLNAAPITTATARSSTLPRVTKSRNSFHIRPSFALAQWFAFSTFWCSALLFWLEPLVGKQLLPLVGGAPAVWNVCLLFFQSVLLAGYATAHGLVRLRSRFVQLLLWGGLLLAANATLPIAFETAPSSADQPVVWLFGQLLVEVGLPFLALAVATPLFQYWFDRSASRRDPYFLYAASNAGSLTALLAFPIWLEPRWPIGTQNFAWAAAFLGASALIGSAAWLSRRRAPEAAESAEPATVRPARLTQLRWLALSFAPSSLLLGVTSFLTTDLAPVPLLWILPLALYLSTFIVAFGVAQAGPSRALHLLTTALALAWVAVFRLQLSEPLWLLLVVHLGFFCLRFPGQP